MRCPRCKGLRILLNRKATDILACVAEPIAAFVTCNWCDGSGVSDRADLAGAGTAEGGTRYAAAAPEPATVRDRIVVDVTPGHEICLPAAIAARRIDLMEAANG